MRQRLLLLVLAWAISGCGPKIPANTDPQTRAAFYANEAVLRLGELQNAAIASNRSGAISDRDAILVVRFTVASTKTVKEAPGGWVPTVRAAYTQLRPQLSAPEGSTVAVALAVLDALLLKVQARPPTGLRDDCTIVPHTDGRGMICFTGVI